MLPCRGLCRTHQGAGRRAHHPERRQGGHRAGRARHLSGRQRQEDHTIEAYSQFLQVCKEQGDIVSARLFERIIDEEQAHLTYYDNIAGHIERLGDTYLAKIAGTPSSTGTSSKGFVTGTAAAE